MDVDVLNEDKVNSQSLELSKKPKYIMQYVPLYEDVDTYAYNKFSLGRFNFLFNICFYFMHNYQNLFFK